MFGDNGAHDWIEPPKKPRQPRQKKPCAECAALRQRHAKLSAAAQSLVDYQSTGAPEFYEWDAKFDALGDALEADYEH